MHDQNRYDEITLSKVYGALEGLGYSIREINDIITSLQNEHILFREPYENPDEVIVEVLLIFAE